MSSARYKHDIRDMGAKSAGLLKLRPVTFLYNNDQTGTLQYGVVAEEVARVYPELVSGGADGKVKTVRYLELIPMLLNELQEQAKEMREERRENEQQTEQIQQLSDRGAEQAVQIEQQAVQTQRLSARVARLKAFFEQATFAQGGTASLAAAPNQARIIGSK